MKQLELTYDQKNIIINLVRFLPGDDQECPQGSWSGRSLRKSINSGKLWFWQRWSAAGFYQLLANMENDGIINHILISKFINGYEVIEHRYSITSYGRRIYESVVH